MAARSGQALQGADQLRLSVESVTANPATDITLYDNIQRLGLDVRTIAPFHGARVHDVAEVAMQARR